MRGDSLRDLYAKTLALLGLGVLAGAGALVDYWPIQVKAPDAGSALDIPALARALPVSDQQSVRIVRTDLARPSSRVSLRETGVLQNASYTSLPIAPISGSGLGEPVGLPAPAVHTAAAVLPSLEPTATAADGYDVHLNLSGASTGAELPEPVFTSASADSDGFITGAFKKTGSSIVRTGVKTGSSIVDAVRVVGGAVRKALPN